MLEGGILIHIDHDGDLQNDTVFPCLDAAAGCIHSKVDILRHAAMKLAQQEFLFILPRSFGASDMFRLAETAKLVTTCS